MSLGDAARMATEMMVVRHFGPDAEMRHYHLDGVELDWDEGLDGYVARIAASCTVERDTPSVLMKLAVDPQP